MLGPCCRDTVESLLTASDVADALGISRMQVWRRAQKLRLGLRIGQPGREITVFSPEDLEKMRAR